MENSLKSFMLGSQGCRVVETWSNLSNVCEAAVMSIFWAPTDSTHYSKCVLNFPLTWLANWRWRFEQGKQKMVHTCLLHWCTGEGSEPGFWHHFADGLVTWSLVPSVAQSICLVILLRFKLRSNKVCVTFYMKYFINLLSLHFHLHLIDKAMMLK